MRKILINKSIVLIFTILLFSCDGMTGIVMDIPPVSPGETPPFVITRPVSEIIERPFHFKFAGITFKFLNQTETIVDRITVSFLLFDQRTQNNPFTGSNKFEISKRDTVFPNESKEIIISLDSFIHIAPTEPYLIDSFFIYEVHYADGSIWQDKYGKFRVRD